MPSYDQLRAIFAKQQTATILGSQHGHPNELRSHGAFALLTAPIMHKIRCIVEIQGLRVPLDIGHACSFGMKPLKNMMESSIVKDVFLPNRGKLPLRQIFQ